MKSNQNRIHSVPTNIITGFLGVGKTSAILHLMCNKPANERWAVLVNEFGEIGVDGSLFQGQHSEEQGVFIREVPGGCMCCAAGLPMQIALNQLLTKANPDRLLIEPTGLGHPEEVLQVLSSEHYRDILLLQKILTLVDARKLTDPRYTGHEAFNQQIAMADIIIGNKLDLYQDKDKARLLTYVEQWGKAHAQVLLTQQGEMALSVLQGSTAGVPSHSHHHLHESQTKPPASGTPIPDCGFIRIVNDQVANKGEGFGSMGWRFSPNKVFNRQRLYSFLTGLQQVERMKAVFITDEGLYGYNLTADGLTEIELDDCPESRIEVISDKLNEQLEAQLLACVVDSAPVLLNFKNSDIGQA